MRPRRWAVALTSLATAGTGAFVLGLPTGSAAVALGRIEVSARGDAMYFEVNSASIPASPTNNASSLYMETQLSSTGGSTATASTPFFGSTVQNLPGTANGVPPQFGFKDLQFPFTRLPGFITCRDTGEENGQFGFGRVNAKCGQGSSEAHGSQGAPPEIPAPNQQETADAITHITGDGTSVAEATGTVKGFVMGPLEIGNAIATATVRSGPGRQPEITGSTSGTFSVNGQKFGFTEKGMTFAGQGNGPDALKQADDALKAAGLQIEVAPVTKSFDEVSGRTSYTIGGMKITSKQKDSELVYILCRASITSVNEASADSLPALDPILDAQPGETTGGSGGNASSAPAAGAGAGTGADAGVTPDGGGSTGPSLSSRSALSRSSLASPSSGTSSLSSPSTSDSTSGSTATEPVPAPAPARASQALGPRTLGGFRPAARTRSGTGTGWLYLLIALGGIAVFGGQAALSRFAVTRG
ncbi:MAG: hypothetical protein QOJ23_795 [Actinomycetota bacterium]|jgi:hypothetical protein|nr:hypothetical protein [Actinomycetota bacterium]